MRLAVRVDGSVQIGTGHITRCLSLALALRAQGAEVEFIVRDLGSDAGAPLRAAGFPVQLLPPPSGLPLPGDGPAHAAWAGVSAEQDASQTLQCLAGRPPAWLLIDHYAFDAKWHRQVADGLHCRLAAIDDLGDRNLAVDLLIDHNHAADHHVKYAARLGAGTQILGGPQYALLAPEYLDAPRCKVGDRVDSIGIFMGGVDTGRYSERALEALELLGYSGAVEVVSTRANPHLDALRDRLARHRQARLTLNQPGLSAFFARHDLQIGASGGATWERCCIGAPTLAIVVADNQRLVVDPLRRLGVVMALDQVPPSAGDISRGVKTMMDNPALRRSLSACSRLLVDGRGASRVATRLLSA